MTFAEKLKELREQASLTQTQLAEASGVSLGTLRDYEQGKRRADPSLSTVARLAAALGVSLDVFRDCAAAPSPSPPSARTSKAEADQGGKRRKRDEGATEEKKAKGRKAKGSSGT